MQSGGRLSAASAAEQCRRLAVLTLVLIGSLTMHGFLALSSAGPAVASGQDVGVMAGDSGARVADDADQGVPVHGPPPSPGSGTDPDPVSTRAVGGGGEHDPASHAVLAGCVLGLAGVVGVALILAALRRRAAVPTGGATRWVRTALAPSVTPDLAPASYRLCVMRV